MYRAFLRSINRLTFVAGSLQVLALIILLVFPKISVEQLDMIVGKIIPWLFGTASLWVLTCLLEWLQRPDRSEEPWRLWVIVLGVIIIFTITLDSIFEWKERLLSPQFRFAFSGVLPGIGAIFLAAVLFLHLRSKLKNVKKMGDGSRKDGERGRSI